MLVRRACEADIPAVLRLLVQVNMVHHTIRPDLFRGPTTKYNADDLRTLFRDDSQPVFVAADEGGTVLGHCFCQLQQRDAPIFTPVRTLYIDDICVDEAARNRGVGRTLYDHAADFARAAGCCNVTLNVWAGNEAARSFYEGCGMTVQRVTMEQIL
ncbi:MAG: GNAT family N-acetyltransferase [Ruminococcaceae bacterium]|jgi:ribosomal protein S18 acetylase RimI-like enzyme|nr:GNAT family N-acetyltransferase [Oscillospiraceae bacterium]